MRCPGRDAQSSVLRAPLCKAARSTLPHLEIHKACVHRMPTREALLGLLLIRPVFSFPRPLWRAPFLQGTFCVRRVGSVARLPLLSVGESIRFGSSHSRATAATASNSPAALSVTASAAMSSSEGPASIHWFRKGLRLHDNRALLEACDGVDLVFPLFVMDSDPASPESRAGSAR